MDITRSFHAICGAVRNSADSGVSRQGIQRATSASTRSTRVDSTIIIQYTAPVTCSHPGFLVMSEREMSTTAFQHTLGFFDLAGFRLAGAAASDIAKQSYRTRDSSTAWMQILTGNASRD